VVVSCSDASPPHLRGETGDIIKIRYLKPGSPENGVSSHQVKDDSLRPKV